MTTQARGVGGLVSSRLTGARRRLVKNAAVRHPRFWVDALATGCSPHCHTSTPVQHAIRQSIAGAERSIQRAECSLRNAHETQNRAQRLED